MSEPAGGTDETLGSGRGEPGAPRDELSDDELAARAGDEATPVIRAWPSQPQEAAIKTVQRYGQPDAVMPNRLVWLGKGPWKRVVVNRNAIPHRFPQPHNDLLEGWVGYRVPPDKVSELARFDGSVIVERTRGEIGARADKEEMNYLALNLAHDLITGHRDVDEARHAYTEKAAGFLVGGHDPYTEGLRFPGATGGTGDPDVETMQRT